MTSTEALRPGPAPARSYLYVPADNARRLDGAVGLATDAVIADLQDGVGPTAKDLARQTLRDWLSAAEPGIGPQRWVRVDPRKAEADVAAAVSPALTGLVVADAELAAVSRLHDLLTEAERAHGLVAGSIALLPLIESAAALFQLTEICRAPRVSRLGVGEVDLAADLGIRPGPDGAELAHHRFWIAAASAAVGLHRPLGPTSTDFRDLERFEVGSHQLLRQGFRARTAIHPAQLEVIHRVFTPTAEELAAAGDLVERWRAAGSGVALDAKGRLIDGAVVRSALETLALARP